MTRMKQGIAASMVCIHVLAPIPLDDINLVFPSRQDASAVLLSPDTKVPKNAEVALRRAVPVVNQDLRKIQVHPLPLALPSTLPLLMGANILHHHHPCLCP